MLEQILQVHPFKKLVSVLHGGPERYHSSLSALKAYAHVDCNLLIHDAVRPLVDPRIISDVIRQLEKVNAVNVAVPATDTIIEVDKNILPVFRTAPDYFMFRLLRDFTEQPCNGLLTKR